MKVNNTLIKLLSETAEPTCTFDGIQLTTETAIELLADNLVTYHSTKGYYTISLKGPKTLLEIKYIQLFHKIYEYIEDADINHILAQYVPKEIMDDQNINQSEFLPYMRPKEVTKLMVELNKYYCDNK
jgi:hypothetical protein